MISVFHTPRDVLESFGIRWNQYVPSESGLYTFVKSREPSGRVGRCMGAAGAFVGDCFGFDILIFLIYMSILKNLFNF
jgi:hypothetical protein